MNNIIMTVDLESMQEQDITPSVEKLLNLFEEYNVKATFFVVANLIPKYKDLIKKISKKHELASHSLSHKNLKSLSLPELRREISGSKKLIESSGVKCLGFRSPFHIPPKHLPILLKENNYLYDASISRSYYPDRYNMRSAPNKPYLASEKSLKNKGKFILEFPVSSFSPLKLPFGLSFIKAFHPFYPLKHIPNNSLFYLHSYEITPHKIAKSEHFLTKLFMKRNKNKAELFLKNLLKRNFNFISCHDFIKSNYPELLR